MRVLVTVIVGLSLALAATMLWAAEPVAQNLVENASFEKVADASTVAGNWSGDPQIFARDDARPTAARRR